jgi:small basic protein (TIGR04137 family)
MAKRSRSSRLNPQLESAAALLSAGPSDFIMIPRVDDRLESEKERSMSIDKSLRRKNSLQRARNVLTRGERIKTLMDEERWQEGRSPYNLPKVKVVKLVVKKAKKAKEEEKPEGEAAAATEAAPAAEKK